MTPPVTPPAGRPALDLRSLLAPRSVAVIGASPDHRRHNGRPVANLLRTGFAGDIYPVNPKHADVDGLTCYPTIGDVAGPVDVAYVMLRSQLVEGAVEECAAHGVPNIVVCSSGFAEEGDAGAQSQERLRRIAWAHGSRVIGPNCIGIVNVPDNVASCTTLNVTTAFVPGDVSIVSQSGGMAANLFNRAQGAGVGVRAMVSLGNEADVDLADVIAALALDEATNLVMLYVEQLRDFPRFRAAVAEATDRGTRVLALKVGRSAAGVRSARSHTGALAGSHAVFRAAMDEIGVVVVDSVDELVDASRATQALGVLGGRRVLVVSPSGGECGYVADRAADAGLDLPELSEPLRRRLAGVMRFGAPGNPLDLTGQVIGDDDLLDAVFAAVDGSGEFDAVHVALPTWGDVDSERLMPAILRAVRRSSVPMVVSAWQSANLTEFRDELLAKSDVVSFGDADRAVRALGVLARLGTATGVPRPEPLTGPRISVPPAALADEAGAKRFLASLGLPVGAERTVADESAAVAAAAELGWPVVVKGSCAGVAHKSDYGLVRTGLQGPVDVGQATSAIATAAERHRLDLRGFLVARQYAGLEMIVGAVPDANVGPVMMLGAGGVAAEVLEDTAFVTCPASPDAVDRALDGLRVSRLLRGHRGPGYDVAAFVALAAAFSQVVAMLEGDWQVDLNPVIVLPPGHGAWVVDALIQR